MGKINPNHISISDFSEYVNGQPLMLAKAPFPCQLVRNKLVRMKWCTVMLLDLTPPAYFVALLIALIHQTTKCAGVFTSLFKIKWDI